MDSDFFRKFMSIDDVIILRHLDNIYVIGMGIVVIRLLITLLYDFSCGQFFIPIVSEVSFSVFLLFMWRVFCEILYTIAPKDKR